MSSRDRDGNVAAIERPTGQIVAELFRMRAIILPTLEAREPINFKENDVSTLGMSENGDRIAISTRAPVCVVAAHGLR